MCLFSVELKEYLYLLDYTFMILLSCTQWTNIIFNYSRMGIKRDISILEKFGNASVKKGYFASSSESAS